MKSAMGAAVRLGQTDDPSSTAPRRTDASDFPNVMQARPKLSAPAGLCLSPGHPVSQTAAIQLPDAAVSGTPRICSLRRNGRFAAKRPISRVNFAKAGRL